MLKIHAEESNLIVYSWNESCFQFDITFVDGDVMCIASFDSLELALRFMYLELAKGIKSSNEKINAMLRLANDKSASIGEVINSVRLALKLNGGK